MKNFLTSLLVLTITAAAWAAPEIGQPAPAFSLKDTEGKQHSLADFKGKTVVLEWVNYGCPFVKKHYDSQSMQKFQSEATKSGLVWLSICSSAPGKQGNETPDMAKSKFKEYDAAATAYLLDEDGAVGRLYNAKTTPEMFIVNPEGKLIYMGAIDDKPTPDPASVTDAKNFVRVALQEAAEGKPVTTPSTKPYGCSVKY